MVFNVSFETIDELRLFANTFATVQMGENKATGETAYAGTAISAGTITDGTVVGNAPQPDPVVHPEIVESVQEKPTETEEIKYSLQDVRAKLNELSKAGKRENVQELIKSYGVDKLSQIEAKDYPDLMQKAGDL